jgi:hypothetical protein
MSPDTTVLIVGIAILVGLLLLLAISRLCVGRNQPTFDNTYTHNGDMHEHHWNK